MKRFTLWLVALLALASVGRGATLIYTNVPISAMSIATNLATNAWFPIIQPLPTRTTNDNFRVSPRTLENGIYTTNLPGGSVYFTNVYVTNLWASNFYASNFVYTFTATNSTTQVSNLYTTNLYIGATNFFDTNQFRYQPAGDNTVHIKEWALVTNLINKATLSLGGVRYTWTTTPGSGGELLSAAAVMPPGGLDPYWTAALDWVGGATNAITNLWVTNIYATTIVMGGTNVPTINPTDGRLPVRMGANSLGDSTLRVDGTNTVADAHVWTIEDAPWWGADPTGVADSTAEIQAMVNHFSTNAATTNGARVHFPQGTYLISSSILFSNANPSTQIGWNVEGDGATASIIVSADPAIDYFVFKSSDYATVRGLGFLGANVNNRKITPTTQKFLSFAGWRFGKVENCSFWGSSGYGVYLDYDAYFASDRNAFANQISNCRFILFGKAGIGCYENAVNGLTIGPGNEFYGGRMQVLGPQVITLDGVPVTTNVYTSFVDPYTTNQIIGIDLSGNNVIIGGGQTIIEGCEIGVRCFITGEAEPNLRAANWKIDGTYFELIDNVDILVTGPSANTKYFIANSIKNTSHVVTYTPYTGVWERGSGIYTSADLISLKDRAFIEVTNQVRVLDCEFGPAFSGNIPSSGYYGLMDDVHPTSTGLHFFGELGDYSYWRFNGALYTKPASSLTSHGLFLNTTNNQSQFSADTSLVMGGRITPDADLVRGLGTPTNRFSEFWTGTLQTYGRANFRGGLVSLPAINDAQRDAMTNTPGDILLNTQDLAMFQYQDGYFWWGVPRVNATNWVMDLPAPAMVHGLEFPVRFQAFSNYFTLTFPNISNTVYGVPVYQHVYTEITNDCQVISTNRQGAYSRVQTVVWHVVNPDVATHTITWPAWQWENGNVPSTLPQGQELTVTVTCLGPLEGSCLASFSRNSTVALDVDFPAGVNMLRAYVTNTLTAADTVATNSMTIRGDTRTEWPHPVAGDGITVGGLNDLMVSTKLLGGGSVTLTTNLGAVTITGVDTTYSAGNGMSLAGTTFSTKLLGGGSTTLSTNGGTGEITITSSGTTYSAGDGMSLVGTTFSTKLAGSGGVTLSTNLGEITISGSGSDTFKLKVDAADTTEDYLVPKLSAGSNITITTNNVGGNEQLVIAATGGGTITGTNIYDFWYPLTVSEDTNVLIAANGIGDNYLRQGAARSVIGRAANSGGNVADIAGAGAGTWLNDNGTSIAFRSLGLSLTNHSITGAGTVSAAGMVSGTNVAWTVTGSINSSDNYLPVRDSATSWADSPLYRVAVTNVAFNARLIMGPGTTNVIYRDAADALVYTNGLGTAFKVARNSGYTGAGTRVLYDDGTYKSPGGVTATNLVADLADFWGAGTYTTTTHIEDTVMFGGVTPFAITLPSTGVYIVTVALSASVPQTTDLGWVLTAKLDCSDCGTIDQTTRQAGYGDSGTGLVSHTIYVPLVLRAKLYVSTAPCTVSVKAALTGVAVSGLISGDASTIDYLRIANY